MFAKLDMNGTSRILKCAAGEELMYSDNMIRLLIAATKQNYRASLGTSCEIAPSERKGIKGCKIAYRMNAKDPIDHS
jgi:hypothetical protein